MYNLLIFILFSYWNQVRIYNNFKVKGRIRIKLDFIGNGYQIKNLNQIEFELKFIMSSHPNKIITRTQQSQSSKSRVRVSRLDQQIDDMHVMIQSSVPVPYTQDHQYKNHKQPYESSKYYIHIDQEDGSNFDLTVKLGTKSQNMQIRSNGRYLTQQTDSPQTSNQYNQDANQSHSQIRYQQLSQPLYEPDLGKTQNLYKNRLRANDFANGQRNQANQVPTKHNRVTTTETRHIIKIIGGRYENNNYQSVPPPKQTDKYAAPFNDQQRYYSNYSNQDQNIKKMNEYSNQNTKNSFKKQREEKSFANMSSQVRNKEGKIMKNGDSKKNIKQQQSHHNYQINKQYNNKNDDKNYQRSQQYGKPIKQVKEIEQFIPSGKKITAQKANQKLIGQAGKQNNIMYFSQNQKGNTNINGEKLGHKSNQQKNNNNQFRTIGRQEVKNIKTPTKNYLNSTIADSRYDQLSPIIYQYKNDQIPDYDDVGPIFVDDSKSPRRKKIFNQKNNLDKKNSIEDEFDSQRRAPFPYETQRTLEKTIQKQILNEPPSVTEIPSKFSNKKVVSNNPHVNQKYGKRTSDSPIVVPISRLPRGSSKKHEMNLSTQRQSRRSGAGLNSYMRDRTKTEVEGEQVLIQDDIFTINKRKYLDKLRRQEQSRSRLQQSRTLSRRSKPTLSPECSRITNRLYGTPINKQPCPKFVRDQERMQRIQMKQTLGEYTFIRRYLSDRQIYEILAQFQNMGVPQRKWPMKLVDIVYDKLKAMKSY